MPAAFTPGDWLRLLVQAALAGLSFVLVGLALREWPPLAIAEVRFAIAAVLLGWLSRRHWRRDAAALRACLVMGALASALPFWLILQAQRVLPAGAAAILCATTPVWGVLLAHAAGQERATPARLLGAALGFAGVAVLVGLNPAELVAQGLPALAMLAATLCYAVAGLYARRFAVLGLPPLAAAAGQTSAAALLLLPVMLLAAPPWTLPLPGPATIAALAMLGCGCSALALWLYFRLVATAGAVRVMLVTLLAPAFALGFGVLALQEAITARQLLGLACIAAGLLLIDGALPAYLARRGGFTPARSHCASSIAEKSLRP